MISINRVVSSDNPLHRDRSKKLNNQYEKFNFKSWKANYGGNFRQKDNFKEFYSEFDDFLNFKKVRNSQQRRKGKNNRIIKGKNITLNVGLEFLEAVNGTKKEIVYHKTIRCQPCGGSGNEKSQSYCHSCGGKGYINIRTKRGYSQIPCMKVTNYFTF